MDDADEYATREQKEKVAYGDVLRVNCLRVGVAGGERGGRRGQQQVSVSF